MLSPQPKTLHTLHRMRFAREQDTRAKTKSRSFLARFSLGQFWALLWRQSGTRKPTLFRPSVNGSKKDSRAVL